MLPRKGPDVALPSSSPVKLACSMHTLRGARCAHRKPIGRNDVWLQLLERTTGRRNAAFDRSCLSVSDGNIQPERNTSDRTATGPCNTLLTILSPPIHHAPIALSISKAKWTCLRRVTKRMRWNFLRIVVSKWEVPPTAACVRRPQTDGRYKKYTRSGRLLVTDHR